MALNNEDKADVSKAMGKALANKVSKVTKDRKYPYHEKDGSGTWLSATHWRGSNVGKRRVTSTPESRSGFYGRDNS